MSLPSWIQSRIRSAGQRNLSERPSDLGGEERRRRRRRVCIVERFPGVVLDEDGSTCRVVDDVDLDVAWLREVDARVRLAGLHHFDAARVSSVVWYRSAQLDRQSICTRQDIPRVP